MKQYLSLLLAMLIVCSAITVMPLSAAAEETGDTITVTADPPPNETQAPEGETIVPVNTTDPIEEDPVDYPIITKFENQKSGVKITWDAYNNNTSYRVYYRKAASYTGTWEEKYAAGGWTRLATVKGTGYLHTGVKDAEIGIYTVRCVNASGQFTSGFFEQGWENCYYAAPVISAISFKEDGVQLSWNQSWKKHGVHNGEYYRVYRKTAKTSWTRVADGLTNNTYFDASAKPGTTYTYTIRMVNADGTRFLSDHNDGKSVSFNAYPLITDITNTNSGAKLTWLTYSGAAKYRIYYQTKSGWTRLTEVTGTSYLDKAVKHGESRIYTIRAVDKKGNFVSDYKRAGWTNYYFTAPEINTIDNTLDGVKLTWKLEPNGESYRVYRKTTGSWTLLTQTEEGHYVDKTAVSGVTYTYTIRMITYDGKHFMSDHLSGKSITYIEAPYVISAKNETDGAKITWSKSSGAAYYRLYYRGDSGWSRIAQVTGTTYLDTTVSDGETREYTVRCLDAKGNFVNGYYQDGYENTYYAPPKFDDLYVTDAGVTLEWKRAEGAEHYRIYRSTDNSTWERLIQTEESSYTDTTAVMGVRYYYTLRMVTVDGCYFMSSYTSGESIIPCETPEITVSENGSNGAVLRWDAVDNAYAYRIYYLKDAVWTRLSTVHDTTYTDRQIAHGETRAYTIRCVDEEDHFNSYYKTNGKLHTYSAPPVITGMDDYLVFHSIRWESQPDAVSYRLYRKHLGDNDWTLISNNITDTYYVDYNIEAGGIYAYTLQAQYAGRLMSAMCADHQYYQYGTPVNGIVTVGETAYRLSDGRPVTGFYRENGVQYFYRDGVRVEQNWYRQHINAQKLTSAQWLYALMVMTGDAPAVDPADENAVFTLALERGIIGSYDDSTIGSAVTRRFVAQTLVNALGYEKRSTDTISDLSTSDTDLYTVAYYGYFVPDSSNKIYPNAAVTAAEFDGLLSELRLCRLLKSKTVACFGDSIMQGTGNNNRGFGEMLCEKYGMYCHDYAANGAVMGTAEYNRGHVPTHIRKAIAADQQADLILIDGGTNDMLHTQLGSMSEGYDMSDAEELTYSGGFEKAMWLIHNNWKNTPVIYVRAHNMNLVSDVIEQQYGNRGIEIAEKWNAATVDLYNDSGMNTENSKISDRYTYKNNPAFAGRSDSIHPNALGYATFYLPAVSEKLAMLFNG